MGVTTENKKLSRCDRSAHHLGCGDSFTGIYICQNIKLYTLNMQLIMCQLCLREGDASIPLNCADLVSC